jgi:phage portal protein BeeE
MPPSKSNSSGLVNSIKQFMFAKKTEPDPRDPEPRKGLWRFLNTSVNKKQQKLFTLNAETLSRLANSDPITWAIRRTIRAFVNQAEWDIDIDTEAVEQEVDRWEEYALSHLSPYAIGNLNDFHTDKLDPKLVNDISSTLKKIMTEPTAMSEKKKAIQWYFASVVRQIRAEAESHIEPVKKIFSTPSERGVESTFRTLQDLLLDDILIYDAGCLVKNLNHRGELAELYHIPGKDVRIYRNEDRTIPLPPDPAFVWEDGGIIRAEFTKDELIYMVSNPQASGYGISPLEVAAYVITASIYADEYNIDYFKNSNVPPGVFDLGKDVTDDQRTNFQSMWENEIKGRGGLHKMLFISGSENSKFIPIRNMSNRDMQMMEYLKWTLAIKTACYGLSGQDIGFVVDYHRTTSETQQGISRARGIQTVFHLLQQYYNTEIVKKEIFDSNYGKPYSDIKFVWQDSDVADQEKESNVDARDIEHGVLSINERRKKLGLKPVDGGDTVTIATPQVVAVSDLAAKEEGREDIDEQAAADKEQGAPNQNLKETPKPGEKPTPKESDKKEEVAAKPEEEKAPTTGVVAMKVNRRKPIDKQHEMLKEVVQSLQEKGIDATIKIGFEDAKTIAKDK